MGILGTTMSLPPEQDSRDRPAHASASEQVREASFPLALRGYDRRAVDEYVAELTQLVDELEGRQLREKVVQRALDEVGEQTASILQQAHEAADELAARSRAQAEGRLQRAEREAELLKAEADKYAEQVAVDTRRLWKERQALIEEVRRLADEAMERLTPPQTVAAALADDGRSDEEDPLPADAEAPAELNGSAPLQH